MIRRRLQNNYDYYVKGSNGKGRKQPQTDGDFQETKTKKVSGELTEKT